MLINTSIQQLYPVSVAHNDKGEILQKYNMFMAQIGCAAFGVLALYLFGPGWLARSTALAASVAFMIATNSIHPPGNLIFYLVFSA